MKKLILILALLGVMVNNVMSYPFWQSRLNSRHVKKLNGVINIPEFSVQASSKECLENTAAFGGGYFGDPKAVSTGFTFSAWIKLMTSEEPASPGYIIFANGEPLVSDTILISVLDTKLRALITTSDVYEITSNLSIQPNVWTHVTVVYRLIDTTSEAKIYINGELDSIFDGADLGQGGINPPGDGVTHFGMYGNLSGDEAYRLSGAMFWNYALTQKELQSFMFRYPSPYTVGLLYLVPFKDITETVGFPKNLVTGNGMNPNESVNGVEDFPNCHFYGYSRIVGEYTITTGKSFSLHAPVQLPNDCVNFVACISYTVEDCGCRFPVTKRYQLWHYCPEDCLSDSESCEEKLVPNVEDYKGQVIPSGAKLEIWAIDGQSTADLEEIYELVTSILHPVVTFTETAKTEDADLGTINTNIAEPFPLVFPLTFDQPLFT